MLDKLNWFKVSTLSAGSAAGGWGQSLLMLGFGVSASGTAAGGYPNSFIPLSHRERGWGEGNERLARNFDFITPWVGVRDPY